MVLDYSKVCAACSTPLDSPPRDGPDSMCALLHTDAGRATLQDMRENRERRDKRATSAVTPQPNVVPPDLDGVTSEAPMEYGVTFGVTNEDEEDGGVTGETRQQRHYRLNRERINQERRDRRNSHGGDGVL